MSNMVSASSRELRNAELEITIGKFVEYFAWHLNCRLLPRTSTKQRELGKDHTVNSLQETMAAHQKLN